AGERDELHLAGLAGLEPHRGAGRNVEPHAAGLLALELQRRVGLEEMVVRADLDRTVAGIGDRERHGLAAGIELDLAVLDEEFTGDHLSSSVIPAHAKREPGISIKYFWIPGSAVPAAPERR